MPAAPTAITWIRSQLGPGATVGPPLAGGVTSRVHLVETGEQPAVLKQVTNRAWLGQRPDVIDYEARVLRYLAPTSIPVPRVLAVDPTGAEAVHPSILLSWIDGSPAGDAAPPIDWLDSLAGIAADIGRIEAPPWIRPFARYLDTATSQPPSWAADRSIWQAAIDLIGGSAPDAPERFIHRDYHPWNLLWNGRVIGVVDWSQASVGPAPMDAAHCRANLGTRFGAEVADAFGAAWEAATGLTHDPYWDLVTCIDFLPDWQPSQRGNGGLEAWVRHVLDGVG